MPITKLLQMLGLAAAYFLAGQLAYLLKSSFGVTTQPSSKPKKVLFKIEWTE